MPGPAPHSTSDRAQGVPKLETIYLRRADSRLDALFGRLSPASERLMARLPETIRHDLARRRSPDILRVIRMAQGLQDGDYELASAERSSTLFIHVPKAAGLSISHSLYGSRSGGHIPYYQYLWTYGARRMRAFFKFSFVREPRDRLISAYSFLASGGKTDEDRVWADENLTRKGGIDRFIQEDLVQARYLNSLHFRPQSFFLADPRTGRPGMDFIGRFESIGKDFDRLCDMLGRKNDLAHQNRSRRDSVQISRDSRRVLETLYKDDYEMFGY